MNEKAQKKLNDILIECGYSHKETKDVVKRYDKNTDQLFKLGKIDFRKEDPNGEIIEKKEVTEIVLDDIKETDIEKILLIEKLRIENENNKEIKELISEIKSFSKLQNDINDINEKIQDNSRFVNYLKEVYGNTNAMIKIMVFWLVLTILNIIGSIYLAIKILQGFNKIISF